MNKGKLSEKYNQKMNNSSSNFQQAYMAVDKPGIYKFRILQDPNDPLEPAFEKFEIHSGIFDPQYQKERSFVCLGYNCPVCAYAQEFAKSNPNEAWRKKKRDFYIYRVLDLSDRKVKLLKASYSLQMAIWDKIKEMDTLFNVNLQDFEEGRDLSLEIRKSQNKTIYKCTVATTAETKPLEDRVIEEIKFLDHHKPLKQLYKRYSIGELTQILKGQNIKNNFEPSNKRKIASKGELAKHYSQKMGIKVEESEKEDMLDSLDKEENNE